MSTFSTAYTDLLDYVNRPSSEMLTQAKREINNTLRWLQRRHNFAMSEKLVKFTYPASSLMVNLTDVCGGLLKSLYNVQILSSSASNAGMPIRQYSYKEIQKERFEHHSKNTDTDSDEITTILDVNEPLSHENYVNRVWNKWCFTMGNNIGLYPMPTKAVELLIDVRMWYNDLSADADTNFLLVYCYDAVIDIATFRFEGIYIKDDSRKTISGLAYQAALTSIESWDAEVRSEHGFIYND